jgi:hypothetical protein
MTQAGGPAALNGFLYQIIQHLGWLTDVTLSGELNGEAVDNACLVLEPRTGGDARAELANKRLVEQYKTRDDATWAILDIEAVLKDLRKAVPSPLPLNASYRFVTDGRAGNLEPLTSFLRGVRSAGGPAELDDLAERRFHSNFTGSNRTYFERILRETRSATSLNDDEAGVVFHLLQHFEMEFGADAHRIVTAIERRIRPYASDLGAESSIREHLVGILMEKLSKGEVQLRAEDIDELLKRAGLSPQRLRRATRLSDAISGLTRRRLDRSGYRSDRDVRAPTTWSEGPPVLLIAGESGAGKTWQLGSLLLSCARAEVPATLIRSGNSADEIVRNAANDFWQVGLGETSERTPAALAAHLRELTPDSTKKSIVVAVDNVLDIDLARDLVRRDWDIWGMRLVMTVSTPVMNALRSTDASSIHVHTVGDFSVDELDALLRVRGTRWADLAHDQKRLLLKPVLAGLFLELPYEDIQKAPRSEYEIFDSFWERIAVKGSPGDEGIVIALAMRVIQGESYPLPRPLWREIGLDNADALARLADAGWLRTSEDGAVEFTHDRLLNWAAAKALTRQFQRQQISADELAARLTQTISRTRDTRLRSLTYIPMDALWLLSADGANGDAIDRTITYFEESGDFGSYGNELYEPLLPTLGQRAVPILMRRMRRIPDGSDKSYRLGLIAEALAALAIQENVDLTDVVAPLLNSQSVDSYRIALAVLAVSPDPRLLDRLWEIHRDHVGDLYKDREGRHHDLYQKSFEALHSSIARAPSWLRDRILHGDAEAEPINELAYQLAALDHPDAPTIWAETADLLIAKVGEYKPRAILNCIARFADHTRKQFVADHLASATDWAGGVALWVLSILDPLAAIDQLVVVDESERYLTRGWWLPTLLLKHPEVTHRRILDLARGSEGRSIVEQLFAERPDDMSQEMLRFVLRDFERELKQPPDEGSKERSFWPYRTLEFLGKITRPAYLAILEEEAGGDLERLISEVAINRPRSNSNFRDLLIETCRRVLMLIPGEGLTRLLLHELSSEHFWVRYCGLKWAALRESEGMIERLAAIAERTRRANPDDRESNDNLEFVMAAKALAALGADEQLVAILQSEVTANVPIDLAWLRADRTMSKHLSAPAFLALSDASSNEEAHIRALRVAWLSDDPDFIPVIHCVLGRIDPSSRVARSACRTLRALGDRTNEFAELARRLLYTADNKRAALEALLAMEATGLPVLQRWLEDGTIEKRHDDEQSVIRALYANPDTRSAGVRLAVERCRRMRYFFDGLYDIAAEENDPALREQVFDKAFAVQSDGNHLVRAIKGLAKFNSTRAIDAAELALQSRPKLADRLCVLIARIDPELAPHRLVQIAIHADRKELRRAVGRALHRLDPGQVGEVIAGGMNGSATERKVVAELAGWISDPRLGPHLVRLAADDQDREVRTAALGALDRRKSDQNLLDLVFEFPGSGSNQRWARLVAILENADLDLMTSRHDALSVGRMLTDDIPPAFEFHANEILKRRRQKEG